MRKAKNRVLDSSGTNVRGRVSEDGKQKELAGKYGGKSHPGSQRRA